MSSIVRMFVRTYVRKVSNKLSEDTSNRSCSVVVNVTVRISAGSRSDRKRPGGWLAETDPGWHARHCQTVAHAFYPRIYHCRAISDSSFATRICARVYALKCHGGDHSKQNIPDASRRPPPTRQDFGCIIISFLWGSSREIC